MLTDFKVATLCGGTKVDIFSDQDASKNALAAKAGFTIFCPRPPKAILTTTIANIAPITNCHTGNVNGTLKASNIPVTTADKSFIVCFLFVALLNKYSDSTHAITEASIKTRAL